MLLARRIRGVSKATQPSDGESRLSNPLDTVSLLEIGLHSYVSVQRHQRFARAFEIQIPSCWKDTMSHRLHGPEKLIDNIVGVANAWRIHIKSEVLV